MDLLIYICALIIIFGFFVSLTISSQETDGKIYTKRFVKNFKDFKYHLAEIKKDSDLITFQHKGTNFTVSYEKHSGKGLLFETIPKYFYYTICINGEECIRLHFLEGRYNRYYNTIEYTFKRNPLEVEEIIKVAFKLASERYKENCNKKPKKDEKSFYNS